MLAVVLMVLSVVWLWDATVHGAKGFVSIAWAISCCAGQLNGLSVS